MIQRIQSAYLLAGFIVLGLVAWIIFTMPEVALKAYRIPFVIVFAATGLAGFVAVFLFKKRALQRRVVLNLMWILILELIGLLSTLYLGGGLTEAWSGAGFLGLIVLIVLAVSLFHRAGKAIKRDIDLVRSMDRIR